MASRGAAGKPEWSSGRGKSWGPRKAAVTGHSAFVITRFCCSFGIFRATTMGPFFTCVGFWRLNLRHSCTLRPVCAWPPPNAPYHSPAKTNSSAGIHSHPATQHGTDPSWRLAALTPGLTVSPDFRPQPGCANETDERPQPSSRPLSTRHNSNPPLDEGAPRGAVYLRRLSQLPGDWRELHCALQWHRLLMAT